MKSFMFLTYIFLSFSYTTEQSLSSIFKKNISSEISEENKSKIFALGHKICRQKEKCVEAHLLEEQYRDVSCLFCPYLLSQSIGVFINSSCFSFFIMALLRNELDQIFLHGNLNSIGNANKRKILDVFSSYYKWQNDEILIKKIFQQIEEIDVIFFSFFEEYGTSLSLPSSLLSILEDQQHRVFFLEVAFFTFLYYINNHEKNHVNIDDIYINIAEKYFNKYIKDYSILLKEINTTQIYIDYDANTYYHYLVPLWFLDIKNLKNIDAFKDECEQKIYRLLKHVDLTIYPYNGRIFHNFKSNTKTKVKNKKCLLTYKTANKLFRIPLDYSKIIQSFIEPITPELHNSLKEEILFYDEYTKYLENIEKKIEKISYITNTLYGLLQREEVFFKKKNEDNISAQVSILYIIEKIFDYGLFKYSNFTHKENMKEKKFSYKLRNYETLKKSKDNIQTSLVFSLDKNLYTKLSNSVSTKEEEKFIFSVRDIKEDNIFVEYQIFCSPNVSEKFEKSIKNLLKEIGLNNVFINSKYKFEEGVKCHFF